MTKADIVKRLMAKTGLSRRQAYIALEAFLSSIKEGLKDDKKVCLIGLGTFLVKAKNPRAGRNPKTGAKINVPAKQVVYFKPGREFRESVKD